MSTHTQDKWQVSTEDKQWVNNTHTRQTAGEHTQNKQWVSTHPQDNVLDEAEDIE